MPFETATDALRFITAGNATVILTFATRRFTLKVRKPTKRTDAGGKVRDHDAKILFVNELTGDPNAGAFDHFVGFFFEDATINLRQSRKAILAGEAKCDAFTALAWVLKRLAADELPDGVTIEHSGNCCRCGREITAKASLAAGIGPECAKHF
jgi:hypothetical protein